MGTSASAPLALPPDTCRQKETSVVVVVGGVISTAIHCCCSDPSRSDRRMLTPAGRFSDDGDAPDGLSCVDTTPK